MEKSESKENGFYIAWEIIRKIIFSHMVERVAKEIFENFPC